MTIINAPINFSLPVPWTGQQFTIPYMMPLTFLVGPNGSGKSRFAEAIKGRLPNCRLLGTDRLDGMQKNKGFGVFGDNFSQGYQKQWFPNFRSFADSTGSGIDTIPLLAERLDIKIKVEATLSHLFNRTITLEWDSGNLLAKAFLGSGGAAYRLDSEECHGIKELLIMLTHLYNDAHNFLIIDEPELNLHPQFQAFFMQEVRKASGNPTVDHGKKGIILITHSPFMLDFRDVEDLQSVISFSINHEIPRDMLSMDQASIESLTTLVPRINIHHKQVFFSDNPIFVEGIFDAQIIQAIQNARNVSIPGSGSCLIEAGGCEEVNKYILLCEKLGKKAYFVYDLDSLFTGNLRGCVYGNDEVKSFLSRLGVTSDFARYCGELDRLLTDLITGLDSVAKDNLELEALFSYISTLSKVDGRLTGKPLQRARIAVLIQMGQNQLALETVYDKHKIAEISGRLKQIASVLAQKNIILLTKGALENYLPSYVGNPFQVEDGQKRLTVESEMLYLSSKPSLENIKSRYGDLHTAICTLPGAPEIDFNEFLLPVLSQLVLEFQGLTLKRPLLGLDEIRRQLFQSGGGRERMFNLSDFTRGSGNEFSVRISIKKSVATPGQHLYVSHLTNTGMRSFDIIEGE